MRTQEFIVPADKAGLRIDVAAAELSGLTRSRVQRLIGQACVRVCGDTVKPNYRTQAGDIITVSVAEVAGTLAPQDIPLEILYQDDFLMVVNKPAGLVVHPAAGNLSGTLVNAVAFHSPHLATAGAPLRPGVVHRLDKDTSGVMVIALEDRAYYSLVEQFRRRTIRRRYRAVLYGTLRQDQGEIRAKIGRSDADRKKMSTKTRRGKEAVTRWKVLARFPGATIVEAVLGTGRTHQIRVHFSSIGHPVLGDETYGKKTVIETGGKRVRIPRQMLHADLLGFVHPATGAYMEFLSELPDDMMETIKTLSSNTRPD